ncbi:hypothetical protein GCM10010168_47550 [Actinoplanes ianthinogenes]|uniref:Uncharacterized protein n=1 Tax=Actinoplanes ianthinogenes TaxID=122358 RepID=A0ABM7LNX2_9ACTN|nr:hypothetical protein [Actinoplanes ianthinogenes]BCJ40945.1 hypothetical protein Aiant_16020 [Actinoplanes ianthinogenes]GGR24027.1 hypothetical protein GCM10010168_47550 [Actinoplanes ianthinogenes]
MVSEDVDAKLRELAADDGFPHREAARRALRFRTSGDVADLVAVADDPHACATTDMLFAMAGHRKTWLNWVPMPQESVVSITRDIVRERAAGKDLAVTELGISGPEPASAIAAFLRVAGPVPVGIADFGQPDPRVPLRPGTYAVWRYRGGDAEPAVAPPSAEAAELLQRVAAEPWPSPLAGYAQAEPLGKLGLDDLLGLLVHPPQAPDIPRYQVLAKSDPVYWYRLLQPWVCLGILHHAKDQPWATSTRRQVLVDLAFGVEDWVSDAALFALVTAAYREPELRAEVRDLVRDRLIAATEAPRPVMIWSSLAHLMLVTPGAVEGEKALAHAVLRQSEDDEEEEAEADEAPEPVPPRPRPSGWRRLFGRR